MKKGIVAIAVVLVAASAGYMTVFGATMGWPKATPNYIQEVQVTAKQFELLPGEVVVTVGRPVRIVVTSVDVDHGILIKGLEVARLVKAGRKSVLEFTPTVPGRYEFQCAVACGLGHQEMQGTLIVEEPLVKSLK